MRSEGGVSQSSSVLISFFLRVHECSPARVSQSSRLRIAPSRFMMRDMNCLEAEE